MRVEGGGRIFVQLHRYAQRAASLTRSSGGTSHGKLRLAQKRFHKLADLQRCRSQDVNAGNQSNAWALQHVKRAGPRHEAGDTTGPRNVVRHPENAEEQKKYSHL